MHQKKVEHLSSIIHVTDYVVARAREEQQLTPGIPGDRPGKRIHFIEDLQSRCIRHGRKSWENGSPDEALRWIEHNQRTRRPSPSRARSRSLITRVHSSVASAANLPKKLAVPRGLCCCSTTAPASNERNEWGPSMDEKASPSVRTNIY